MAHGAGAVLVHPGGTNTNMFQSRIGSVDPADCEIRDVSSAEQTDTESSVACFPEQSS